MGMSARLASLFLPLLLVACAAQAAPEASGKRSAGSAGPACPLYGGRPADELIAAGEEHFAHLWMLTTDGENAEAYWSFAGDRLSFQRRSEEHGIDCDRIFVTRPGAEPLQVSSGRGVTTCAYFMPGDTGVLYASTHGGMDTCPPPIDPGCGALVATSSSSCAALAEAPKRSTALKPNWCHGRKPRTAICAPFRGVARS